jgi:hypothetical protein
MLMAEDKEKKTLKGDHSSKTSSSGSQPSGGEELTPSSSVKRPNWFEMILRMLGSKLRLLGAHSERAGLRRSF